jgi:uncharacterized membrane protein YadS
LGKEIARVMQLVRLLTWVIVHLLVLFMKACLMESWLESPVEGKRQRDQFLPLFVFLFLPVVIMIRRTLIMLCEGTFEPAARMNPVLCKSSGCHC